MPTVWTFGALEVWRFEGLGVGWVFKGPGEKGKAFAGRRLQGVWSRGALSSCRLAPPFQLEGLDCARRQAEAGATLAGLVQQDKKALRFVQSEPDMAGSGDLDPVFNRVVSLRAVRVEALDLLQPDLVSTVVSSIAQGVCFS
eukprot:3869143-Rhodomonas_salina.1